MSPVPTFKFGLLVGINYKGTPNELDGCINDVKSIYTFLTRELGWRSSDIVMLLEKQATHAGILAELTELVRRVNFCRLQNPDARIDVWFHYSGHGSQTYTRSPGEADNKDETLVPYDYERNGQITDTQLASVLKNMDANPKTMCTFFFDCCHSGSILDLPYVTKSGFFSCTFARDRPANCVQWDPNARILCISGCKDSQTSADYNGSGAMTASLLQVLKENDYHITVSDLVQKIRNLLRSDTMIERGFSQIPQLTASTSIADQVLFVANKRHLRDSHSLSSVWVL